MLFFPFHNPLSNEGFSLFQQLTDDREQQEQDKGPGNQSTPEEITKAKEAIAAGLKAVRETS